MRPRSGTSRTVLVLRASTVCCSDSACTVCRNHSRTPIAPNRSAATTASTPSRVARLSAGMATSLALPPCQGALGQTAAVHTSSSRGAFHSGSLTRMHQRPTGTSTTLITRGADADDTDDDARSGRRTGCSSPMNWRITGTTASPTAAPRPVKIAASHHGRAHGDRDGVAGHVAADAHGDRRRAERRADVEVVQQAEHEPGERALLRPGDGAGRRGEGEQHLQRHAGRAEVLEQRALERQQDDARRGAAAAAAPGRARRASAARRRGVRRPASDEER